MAASVQRRCRPPALLPGAGRLAGASDHDGPIQVITMPIRVITMGRSPVITMLRSD